MMYDVIDELTYKAVEDLDNMIQDINREFKSNISLQELQNYITNSQITIYKHIDNMEQELIKMFEGNSILILRNEEVKINDLKQNIKSKLDRIYDQNKNLQKFKKVEWLVVINTIATIGGFIIGIISLIITIKGNI